MIELKNVSFSYGEHRVIDRASFRIEEKDFLCIVGENGSGKSTLLRGILSLKKAVHGEILLENVTKREFGYLPQMTSVQRDFPASVREVVLSGRLTASAWKPFYNAKDKKIAAEIMEELGIVEIAGKSFRELSGGQMRRVLLARALCNRGKMLFLDEPTAGLDPVITEDFYRILEEKKKEGMTICLVTHDIDKALGIADKVVYIRNAKTTLMPVEEFQAIDWKSVFVGGE